MILKSPSPCSCGRALPWHLIELGDKRLSHHCVCGKVWRWCTEDSVVAEPPGLPEDVVKAIEEIEKLTGKKS